jgi:hypothetical protein
MGKRKRRTSGNNGRALVPVQPHTGHSCGEFGGIREDGSFCSKPAGWGTALPGFGPCRNCQPAPVRRFDSPSKNRFLTAFQVLGNITRAAKAAGCDRWSHYYWLREDPDYVQAFEEASAIANDTIDAEIRRRAIYGNIEPVFYKGELVATQRKMSDTLLIVLAKMRGIFVDNQRVTLDGELGLYRAIDRIPPTDAARLLEMDDTELRNELGRLAATNAHTDSD